MYRHQKFLIIPIIVVVVGVGIWWFVHNPGANALEALKDPPKAVAQLTQVEKPVVPKVMAKEDVVASPAAVVAAPPSADIVQAQTELKNTNKDIADVIRKQGVGAAQILFTHQSSTRKMDPGFVQAMFDTATPENVSPEEKATREKAAQFQESLAAMTPKINAAGDRASYYGEIGADGQPEKLARYIKVDGKWYWYGWLGDDPSDPLPWP
jgi:hypothetical protein